MKLIRQISQTAKTLTQKKIGYVYGGSCTCENPFTNVMGVNSKHGCLVSCCVLGVSQYFNFDNSRYSCPNGDPALQGSAQIKKEGCC